MSPRFSYDDLAELLEAFSSLELDPLSLSVRRDRIVELIEPFASCSEICGATPWATPGSWKSEVALQAEEPCVLVAQGSDASGGVNFMMIPRSKRTNVLDNALLAIDGRTFAGPEDLKSEQWDAAVRCMAAMGEGGSSAQSWIENDLTGWDDGERGVADEEILALYDRWIGCDVRDLAGFDRSIERLITIRRAM